MDEKIVKVTIRPGTAIDTDKDGWFVERYFSSGFSVQEFYLDFEEAIEAVRVALGQG